MTTEFYRDPQTVLYLGDVRDVLRTLPSNSIQMAVTSPPYWGLRDYGTAVWDGGDAHCDHRLKMPPQSGRPLNGLDGGLATIDAAEPAIHAGQVKDYRKATKAYIAIQDDHMRTRPSGTIEIKETRNKRDVWIISSSKMQDMHFATFPEQLVEPCILAGSNEGDTILDPFIGSGTTAVAARKLNRNAIGIDLNKDYLAIAQKRITAVTLPMPLHAHS